MDQEKSTAKTLASVGAGAAFCGIVLYALGQTLSFLFRDVDPNRVEKKPEDEMCAASEKDIEADGE